MKKNSPLVIDRVLIFFIFGLALLASEIKNFFLISPTGAFWNDFIPLVFLVLTFTNGWLLFGKKALNKKLVHICALLTALLFFAAGATSYPGVNVHAIVLYLTAIWVLPIVDYLFRSRKRNIFVLAVIGLLALQAQWAIAQFVVQKSLGFQLIGESVMGVDIPGVAKFSTNDGKIIRAYGPYPHANTLGGTMLMGFIMVNFLLFLAPRVTRTPRCTITLLALAFILLLGLVVSFSRAAYTGLGIWLVYLLTGFVQTLRLSHYRQLFWLFIVTIIAFTPLIVTRSNDFDDKAVAERASGTLWAWQIIQKQGLLHGSGPGNYVFTLQQHLEQEKVTPNFWELQPVHAAPLLLLAEWGVIATAAVFLLFVWAIPRRALVLLVPLVPLLLLDHYLYTQLVPLIMLGLVVYTAKHYGKVTE